MWLTAEGVKASGRVWGENLVNQIIRNPVYYGARRNGGNLETEGLVPFQTWQQANTALAERAHPGRSGTVHAKPFLQPVCAVCYGETREGCPSGVSVMYRVWAGKGGYRRAYYRCAGSGPLRKGCGARLVLCDDLDAMVLAWYANDERDHMSRTFHPGRNIADEIQALNKRIADAASAGDYAAVTALGAQAQALNEAEDTRPHWTREKSGVSRGWHFLHLDPEARRTYIAEQGVVLTDRIVDGTIRAAEVYDDEGSQIMTRMF
jgi:hypothetical protein